MPSIKDREYGRNWRLRNLDSSRASGRKNMRKRRLLDLGLSVAEYERLFASQNERCAICGNPETTRGSGEEIRTLSIDHNHETGKVRELLCNVCNRILGLFREDSERLRKAAEYLDKHR